MGPRIGSRFYQTMKTPLDKGLDIIILLFLKHPILSTLRRIRMGLISQWASNNMFQTHLQVKSEKKYNYIVILSDNNITNKFVF